MSGGSIGNFIGAGGIGTAVNRQALLGGGGLGGLGGGGPTGGPAQLRRPPADLAGREAIIDDLERRVRLNETNAVVVTGMGGVGKTSVALALADRVKDLFADAQLFLDLRGASARPATSAEAMAHVIRSFDPAAALPDDEESRRAAYLSVLGGRRAIVFMDNVRDRAHAVALEPPAGCLYIVTSRQRIVLGGAAGVDLGVLAGAAGAVMVRSICPRATEAEAGEIARLCGGLPLALRLVATALCERDDVRVGDYIKSLADETRRLSVIDEDPGGIGGVMASIDHSVRMLTDEQRARWLDLSVFPESFTSYVAAAVLNIGTPDNQVDDEAGRRVLSDLRKWNLIEYDAASERYRLHDLVRDYAVARQAREGGPEAVERAVRAYVAAFAQALSGMSGLFNAGKSEGVRALRWMVIEEGNVRAAFDKAAERATSDNWYAAVTLHMLRSGSSLLLKRLAPSELGEWVERGVAAARAISDDDSEWELRNHAGAALAGLGKYDEAMAHFVPYFNHAQEKQDTAGMYSALGNISSTLTQLGQHDEAIRLARIRWELARTMEGQEPVVRALIDIGNAYIAQETEEGTNEAFEAFGAAYNIARDNELFSGFARATTGVALVYSLKGDHEGALTMFEQRLRLAEQAGSEEDAAMARWNMGEEMIELGRAEGLDLLNARVEYLRAIGHADAEVMARRVEDLRRKFEQGDASGPDDTTGAADAQT